MSEPRVYDVIVVGGGSAGENAAWYAVDNGLSVAVVESDLVGGECSYWACMPSKALLRPGEVLAAARRVPAAAAAVTGDVDVDAALRSRDAFASHWDDTHQAGWLESVGVDLVRGHGRLEGERTVTVERDGGDVVTLKAAKAVVVATGSRAARPPIDGLDDVGAWDSRDVTTAGRAPRRLLMLGGGVVGVEMAQAWKRLGAEEVTVVEMAAQLLPREEPFAARLLRDALEAEGIEVRTDTKAVHAARDRDGGGVHLELAGGTRLTADEIVVATGRQPNTDDVGLESVGLTPGETLDTDDQLRVEGVEGGWLYAVGDVNGRALLTHQGKYQARVAADVIAGEPRHAWADTHAVPRVVFTDPQVAAVGVTQAQAGERGLRHRTLHVALGSAAGASLLGRDTVGAAQIIVDDDRGTLLGATFVGPHAGELLHAATVAIVGEVTIHQLWDAVPAFPTVSEVWLRLLEADRDLP